MFSAAKEEMTLSTCGDPCALFPLAAFEGVGENSRLGITTKNLALHQGASGVISTTALGMQPVLRWEGVRSRYTGKERDSESGLDNFGARYDSSQYGRFMSPDDTDPEEHLGNPQGLNLYSYVQNNPTNATDPDGHDCVYINDNSASVTRGDCKSDTDNGIFVNGTIDTKSGSYDSSTGTLSFNYTNDDTGAIGKGVIGDVYPSGGGGGVGSEAGAVAIFSDINRRNILANTAKIYGAGAAIGLTGGAACYYLCPAATVTTLGIAASPLLPIVPSALEKLQQLGMSVQEATAIVESPASQKLIDNLNNGNINVIQDVGGKLVRITLDPSGQRIISAGLVRANQITNGIANGRFVPK